MNGGGRKKNAKREREEGEESLELWQFTKGVDDVGMGENRRRMGERSRGGVETAGGELHAAQRKLHELIFINKSGGPSKTRKEGRHGKLKYVVGIRKVPRLDAEAAVAEIVWMVEERAREGEEERIRKLTEEKDKEAFFFGRKGGNLVFAGSKQLQRPQFDHC